VPVAAALIAKGISPGAALVFLMTGPATNAATLITIWRLMGKRTGIVYLGTVALTALASGLVLDHLIATESGAVAQTAPLMLPSVVTTISAFALLALLGAAFVRFPRKGQGEERCDEQPGG
jgi:hypothetical protein